MMVYEPFSMGAPAQLMDKVTSAMRRAMGHVGDRASRKNERSTRSLIEVLDERADVLEHRSPLFNAAMLQQTDIVVYMPERFELSPAMSTLKSFAHKLRITQDKSVAESAIMASSAKNRILIFANVTDVHDAVDWLLRLRKLDPEIAIIITSAEFATNDLTTARAGICDASLRQPYTTVNLALGVTAALNNNREIRMRTLEEQIDARRELLAAE
jgi:hypothetical protein